MITKRQKYKIFVSDCVKSFSLAAFVFGLSACGHHSLKDDCCSTRGKQFENEWKVKAIYQTNKQQEAPANVNGTFTITRSKDSIFQLTPDENFSDNLNAEWGRLELQYKPGSDANQRIALVAEICSNNQKSGTNEENEPSTEGKNNYKQRSMARNQGVVESIVHYDFINLLDRELESLETGTQQKLAEKYKITMYHFKNRETNNVDLLIFYCGDKECNKSGMIHSEPR